MSKILTVSSQSFNFPDNRDNAGWGEDASAWASAITDAVFSLNGTGDLLLTTVIINNITPTPQPVLGLSFSSIVTRAAIIEYSIYRSTSTAEAGECGTLYLNYMSKSNSWNLVQVGGGTGAGVTLTVTPAGQIQYLSDVMAGAAHSGSIKFRARTLPI